MSDYLTHECCRLQIKRQVVDDLWHVSVTWRDEPRTTILMDCDVSKTPHEDADAAVLAFVEMISDRTGVLFNQCEVCGLYYIDGEGSDCHGHDICSNVCGEKRFAHRWGAMGVDL